ncbi:MAG: RNA-binding protein [Verrucomicrobiota bacterium]|nr:RNA-binding protein [Verrucomicrobiota bacterium]
MNIFVGNLPYSATDMDLRAAFEAHGTVTSASVILDKFTGKSRGFGFVEMPNREEALAAIAALNEKQMNGRALRVNEAQPREERPRRERRDWQQSRPDRQDRFARNERGGHRGGFRGERGFRNNY